MVQQTKHWSYLGGFVVLKSHKDWVLQVFDGGICDTGRHDVGVQLHLAPLVLEMKCNFGPLIQKLQWDACVGRINVMWYCDTDLLRAKQRYKTAKDVTPSAFTVSQGWTKCYEKATFRYREEIRNDVEMKLDSGWDPSALREILAHGLRQIDEGHGALERFLVEEDLQRRKAREMCFYSRASNTWASYGPIIPLSLNIIHLFHKL